MFQRERERECDTLDAQSVVCSALRDEDTFLFRASINFVNYLHRKFAENLIACHEAILPKGKIDDNVVMIVKIECYFFLFICKYKIDFFIAMLELFYILYMCQKQLHKSILCGSIFSKTKSSTCIDSMKKRGIKSGLILE